jgi:2-polyprenyl-3-methyl-5-hydroxy-6-metoxy-1,4-benzoquinol methylase
MTYGEEVNTAIARQLRRLRPKSILDIGCGAGQNTLAAHNDGAYVIGIDNFRASTHIASMRLDDVYDIDIEQEWSMNRILDKRVECLVFGDVLEHVKAPLTTLRRFLPLLVHNGSVIVSLPNVANWGMRLHLLKGNFEYSDKGIRDITHLRFFTRASAIQLVLDAGLVVDAVDQTPGIAREGLARMRRWLDIDADTRRLDARIYGFYKRHVRHLEEQLVSLWPEALAFQHVVVARKR